MKQMTTVKKIVLASVCAALCVVLPIAFHSVPNAGSIFLPMHIPVLLCGLICGWPFGLACGLIGPLLSSLLTGMPPMAILPSMMAELAVYGAVSGLLMQFVHTGRLYPDIYLALVVALLTGRLVGGVIKALFFAPEGYSMAVWAAGYFVTCWPGLVIQLVLIPAVVLSLEKAKLIPARYPAK